MNNKQLAIRLADDNDVTTIYEFICELENQRFNYDAFKSIYLKNIRNAEYLYFVALIEDEVIGYLSLHTQNLLHHCGRTGEIQEFFIVRKYRNKGIGKILVNEVDKISKTNKLKCIEVTSNVRRIENAEIYKRMGFQLTHQKFTKAVIVPK